MNTTDPDLAARRRRWLLTGLAAGAGLAVAGLTGFFLLQPSSPPPEPGDERLPLRGVRFEDDQGKALTLEDFRGKVVLLNLWATWCPPCREEMPALDHLQRQLGGPGFEVVAVSIDGHANAVREFYHEHEIKSLAPYIDPSGDITTTLVTPGIPTTLLVDREGREVWRKVGPAEWDAPPSVAEIRKHLGAKP